MKKKKKLTSVLILGLSLTTLFIALPNLHFASNYYELDMLQLELLGAGVFLVLIVTSLLYPLVLWQKKGWIEIFLVWLSLSAWLQSQLFAWSGPALDGSLLPQAAYRQNQAGELFLWGGILIIVILVFSRFGRQGLLKLALLLTLLTSEVVVLATQVVDEQIKAERLSQGVDKNSVLRLSTTKNIIVLILDETQNNLVREIFEENLNLQLMYKDFIYFSDVVGGYASTIASFPLIFTGQFFSNEDEYIDYVLDAYSSHASMYVRYKEKGYEINVIPGYPHTFFTQLNLHDNLADNRLVDVWQGLKSVTNLTLFASLPGLLKNIAYQDGDWLLAKSISRNEVDVKAYPMLPQGPGDSDTQFFLNIVARAQAREQQKKFFSVHLIGGHVPWALDREGFPVKASETTVAYKAIVYYKLVLLGGFLERLRQLGVYDQSAVIVLGDHGTGRGKELYLFNEPSGEHDLEVKARATPMLMVKGFGATHRSIGYNETDFSYQTLHNDIDHLINDPALFEADHSVARRYIKYQWQAKFGNFLENYREYIVAGDVTHNAAWWPMHVHTPGFPQKHDCLFPNGNERYRYTREGVIIDPAGKVALEKVASQYLLLKLHFDRVKVGAELSVEIRSGGRLIYQQLIHYHQAEFLETVKLPLSIVTDRNFEVSADLPFSIQDAILLEQLE